MENMIGRTVAEVEQGITYVKITFTDGSVFRSDNITNDGSDLYTEYKSSEEVLEDEARKARTAEFWKRMEERGPNSTVWNHNKIKV